MDNRLRICIFGDFVPINRGIKAVEDRTAITDDIKRIIRDSDYNIINLECPVVSHPDATPILKDGPSLKCSKETVRYLKNVGINLCTLANNHLKDYGEVGIQDTLNACKENDIEWIGAGFNLQEARIPKIIELKNMRIGIVNICENESSIATDEEAGANPIDEINNYYDIIQLREKVDKTILIIHGGVEHYRLPSPRVKKLCHFYADLGVSAIICHHTHCYGGYEIYHNVPILYSLGNFFFDRKKRPVQWKTGLFVQLQVNLNTISFELFPYIQCDEHATVRLLEEKTAFINEVNKLNAIIADDNQLQMHFNKWLEKRYRHYLTGAMTWGDKYYKAAYRRKMAPALISKKNATILLNYIRCETHRELLLKSLQSYLNKLA